MIKVYPAIVCLSIFSLSTAVQGQIGPGGVGTNNQIWYDAARITGVSNNGPVQTLTDFSGNGNHATQATATRRPLYIASGPNGRPALQFDGNSDYLQTAAIPALNNNRVLWFIVGSSSNTTTNGFYLSTAYSGTPGAWGTYRQSTGAHFTHTRNAAKVFTGVSLGTVSGNNIYYTNWQGNTGNFAGHLNNNFVSSVNGANLSGTHSYSRVGAHTLGTGTHFLNGTISEIAVYTNTLNTTQRNLIHNYLGAKYNIAIANDFYAFETTHGSEVAGIGRESASDLHSDARGSSIVRMHSPSGLSDAEYFLWGHDDGGLITNSSNVPASYVGSGSRLNQVWRVSETGDVGTLTIEFDLSQSQFGDPSAYELLVDSDGDFSAGATSIAGTFNSLNSTLTFTGINLSHGDFFTIGNNSQIISVATGDWEDPNTWSCNCIPGSTATLRVDTNHTVTITDSVGVVNLSISNNAMVTFNDLDATLTISGDLNIENGGQLDVSANNNAVFLAGDWISDGVFNPRLGTVTFNGTTEQLMSGPGPTPFYNMIIDNPVGVSISSGAFTLANTLTLVDGVFNTNSNPFTMLSNVTGTAEIGPIPPGSGVLGDVTVQRFITAGNADYRNLASPVIGATLNMWDEPEIFLSGPGFPDGCATSSAGCYASAKFWDAPSSTYVDITDYTASIPNMNGFTMFMGDNLSTFAGYTVRSVVGDINGTDDITKFLPGNPPWLYLVGNPYASAIDFDNIIKTGVQNWFYIFDQSTGNFEWYENGVTSGGQISPQGIIASGQGFWVEKAHFTANLRFQQASKVAQDGPFVRKRKPDLAQLLQLDLYSDITPLSGNVSFLFTSEADSATGRRDIKNMMAPIPEYVSITAFGPKGEDLRRANLSPDRELIEVGLALNVTTLGTYYLDPKNLDNFESYDCITIEDLESGKIYKVTEGQAIPVEIRKTKDSSPRMIIRFTNDALQCENIIADISETDQSGAISIQGEFVKFDLPAQTDARITVYNLLGQQVHQEVIGSVNQGTVHLDVAHLDGVHLIVVETPGRIVSGKSYFNID